MNYVNNNGESLVKIIDDIIHISVIDAKQLKIQNGSLGQLSFIDYQKRWDKTWKKLRRNLM